MAYKSIRTQAIAHCFANITILSQTSIPFVTNCASPKKQHPLLETNRGCLLRYATVLLLTRLVVIYQGAQRRFILFVSFVVGFFDDIGAILEFARYSLVEVHEG